MIPLAGLVVVGSQVAREIFPAVDTGQFLFRLRAPTGTRIERTEEIARKVLDVIAKTAGPGRVEATVGYVGVTPPTFPNQSVHLWTRGPEEAILRIALKHDSGVHVDALKSQLRRELPEKLGSWLEAKSLSEGLAPEEAARRRQALRFSFEPADIVNEVMSFGFPTPVELVIHGPNLHDDLAHAQMARAELEKVTTIRDLQSGQAQDFPSIEVDMDRERAGLSRVTIQDMSRALLSATSSSRYVVLNYWADLTSGNGYQVQVQVPPPRMDSAQEIGAIPVKQTPTDQVLLRDVARVAERTRPGEYDRLDLRRYISLTANYEGSDLGRVATAIDRAIERAGPPPRGVELDIRGQIEPMRQMFPGLARGLVLSVVAIFLLLTAYFQSPKLALVAVSAVPSVLVDMVLDTIGGEVLDRSWRVLRRGGKLASIAAEPSAEQAHAFDVRGIYFIVQPDRRQLETIGRLIDAGQLRPELEAVLPLARAREAFERGLSGHVRGKIVLRVIAIPGSKPRTTA